jgi:hypothetical protein
MGVAARGSVNWGSDAGSIRTYEDGLGTRWLHTDADGCTVEVLGVSPNLAVDSAFEGALRARVARMSGTRVEGLARVRRVERRGAMLQVVAEHVDGLRLPEFLQETIKGNIPLPQPAALELAGRILRIASVLHQVPGISHGSITPAHVVITRGGGVVLTDAVFGPAIEGLQRNREQLWREFRLALPASASLPRFDQRADVTQLGATVLAVALGRPLRAGEYPRSINEAVIAATLAARPGETGTSTSALRMWLQEALHLHPRATFSSAIDAEAAYAGVLGVAAARRGGSAAFEECVERVFGDTPASAAAAALANAWSHPSAAHHVAEPFAPPSPPVEHVPPTASTRAANPRDFSSMLRSVFPRFGAS